MNSPENYFEFFLDSQSFIYIPVRQKIIERLFREDFLQRPDEKRGPFSFFGQITFEENAFATLMHDLEKMAKLSIVIWDAHSVDPLGHHIYEDILFPIIEKKKMGLVVYSSDEDIALATRQAKDAHKEYKEFSIDYLDSNSSMHILTPSNLSDEEKRSMLNNTKMLFDKYPFETISEFVIFNNIKEDKEMIRKRKKNIALKSSNVYANSYFNCARIFHRSVLYQLVIFELANLIESKINKKDFDSFLCASVNGYALATALSTIFKKRVIFLDNLGPIPIMNGNYLDKMKSNSVRYVYIFDFMCLGSEYERVKLICKLMKARLVFSFGISYFRYPLSYNEEIDSKKTPNINTLFNINDFDEHYYKCYINEYDEIIDERDFQQCP